MSLSLNKRPFASCWERNLSEPLEKPVLQIKSQSGWVTSQGPWTQSQEWLLFYYAGVKRTHNTSSVGPVLRVLDREGSEDNSVTKQLSRPVQSMKGFLAKMVFKKFSVLGVFIWSMHFLFARVLVTPIDLIWPLLPAWTGLCCHLNFWGGAMRDNSQYLWGGQRRRLEEN